MALAFGSLLYFQILYLERMVSMRESQFSESVMRSLHATSNYLERQETLHFLEQDVNIIESSLYGSDQNDYRFLSEGGDISLSDGSGLNVFTAQENPATSSPYRSPTEGIGSRYESMREIIRSQYLYQRGLLNEVILSILHDSSGRPLMERADSTVVRNCLTEELAGNGLTVPFDFSITDGGGKTIYSTTGFSAEKDNEIYRQPLFPGGPVKYDLNVMFPTKGDYIFSSVRFIIPALAFTLILLIIFVVTVILIFRQKKLSEMKSDFINNMTHELKTPVSSISLVGQMLNDDAVKKSPAMLKHMGDILTDETKRLRMQVDKVLQMSLLDKGDAALKFATVDANVIIANVVNTFNIKVEKYGGSIRSDLSAEDACITVDEMQFTNVIFNLLDNAVKYRREDVPLSLEITTRDVEDSKIEIIIRDNGIGIKRDDQKRIFDKFYRVPTDDRHDVKGFGLGLAYVKKMITLFGGEIHVESEPDQGSAFIIRLPLG